MQCPIENNNEAGIFLDYCARKTDVVASLAMESHLAICESCQAVVRAQQALWNSLDSWDQVEVAQDFNRKLYARIDAEGGSVFLLRWWKMASARWFAISWWPALPAALACALFIAALWIPWPGVGRPEAEQAQSKTEQLETEQVERTLQDLEMLKQFSSKNASEANSSGSM